jgi:hypothetical protein
MAFGDPIIRQNSHSTNTMNVNAILNNTLSLVTPYMHKTRRAALSARIHSLLTGNAASVTSMGRGIDSPAHQKIILNELIGCVLIHIYCLSPITYTGQYVVYLDVFPHAPLSW